jgi:TonB family protein
MSTATTRRKKTFWEKHRTGVAVGAIVLVLIIIGVVVKVAMGSKTPPPRKIEPIMAIKLPPPPPTPPPTPPPPTPPPEPPKEKMIEQEPVKEEPKPEPKAPEPPALGSAIKGSGDDGFGLSGNGSGFGNGRGIGGGSRSKWGWYASAVQSSVMSALRGHKLVRTAEMTVTVRVWVDSTGRVVRSTLSGSSGRADVDSALKNEVLTGLQLQSAPPEGMPMPIVMRITAKRPN